MTVSRNLTVTEAAELVGRTPYYIRLLIADGHVAARKYRGRWYVSEASLAEWSQLGEPAPALPEPGYVIPGIVKVGKR